MICFYVFVENYHTDLRENYENKGNLLNALGMMELSASRLAMFSTMGAIMGDFVITDDELARLAPIVHGKCRALPAWDLKSSDIITAASEVRDLLEDVTTAFTPLDQTDPSISGIYNAMFVTDYSGGVSLQDDLMRKIYDMMNLFEVPKTSYEMLNDFRYITFRHSLESILTVLRSSTNQLIEKTQENASLMISVLNDRLILSVCFVVVFVGMPFVVSSFQLILMSEAIANVFAGIPMSTIREVLTNNNDSAARPEEKNHQVGHGTNEIHPAHDQMRFTNWLTIAAPFLFATLGVAVVGLMVFFMGSAFAEEANKRLHGAESLYTPLCYLYMNMNRLCSLY